MQAISSIWRPLAFLPVTLSFGHRLSPRVPHGCLCPALPEARGDDWVSSQGCSVLSSPRPARRPLPPPAPKWVVGPRAPCAPPWCGPDPPHAVGSWSVPGLLPSSFLSRLNSRCWGVSTFPRVRHGRWPEKLQPASVPVDETPRLQGMDWVPALCSAEAYDDTELVACLWDVPARGVALLPLR